MTRHKKKKFSVSFALYILAGVTILALIGGAVAKYIQSSDSDSIVRSKEFYFTSDLLDGENHTLTPGATSVTFSLNNYIDQLRFSEDDVAFTLVVKTGGEVDSTVTVDSESTTLTGDVCSSESVTLSQLVPGKTYTVEATGTAGYSKILTGTIVVPAADGFVYKYAKDEGTHVLLTVWAQGYEGNDILISFPADLIPDNTNPAMADVENYSDGAYTAGSFTDETGFVGSKYSSQVYRFFKCDPSDSFDAYDFTVTYDEKEAAPLMPS